MKYLEEIEHGDCFEYKSKFYILTQDYKKNGERLCISLFDGFTNWISPNTIVTHTELFTMDKDNNIIGIKQRKKTDVSN